MILQVIKENEYFPVGWEFMYNEQNEAFVYIYEEEDISKDVLYVNQGYCQFSPSFYEENKELFNQVKLEETNEKNKNTEGPEDPSTQGESENVLHPHEAQYGGIIVATGNMRQELQRKEVEEANEGCESEGPCINEEGLTSPLREYQKNREEDQRAIRFAEIDNILFDLIGQVHTLQEGVIWNLRDEIQQLRKEIR